jgi:hypothetical protein
MAKVNGKVVGKENADGTTTVKVAKGAKVVTSNGKVATGGKIVDTVASSAKVKAATKKSKEIFDELDEIWEDDEDFTDVDDYNNDADVDEEPANKGFIYVTREGIVGNVHEDGFQIIDTSGLYEDDIYQLASADPDDRAALADSLRGKNPVFASRHWFNDTGDVGEMKDVRVVDGSELSKSEMRELLDSEDPFYEAESYDSGTFSFKTAVARIKKGARSNSTDDFLDDDMIEEGTSYPLV